MVRKNTLNSMIVGAILLAAAVPARAQLSQSFVDSAIQTQLQSCGNGCNTAATLRALLAILTQATFQSQGPNGFVLSGTPSQGFVPISTGSANAAWSPDINNAAAYGLSTTGSAAANGSALTSATSVGPAFIPTGTYSTNLSELFGGSTWGTGQWSDGTNLRAPWHYSISSAPTYTGTGFGGGITAAFDGDFTHVPFAIEMLISGASTAGTPASGYQQAPPNQIPHYTELFTSSGYEGCTAIGVPAGCAAANDRRTGQYAFATNLFQGGAGDASVQGFNVFVDGTSTGTGAGGILANPAGAFIGGSISTVTNGNILEVGQISMIDNGADAAGLGWNVTAVRTNANGANGAWWYGFRSQSALNAPIDTGTQAVGTHRIAVDTSFATLPSVVSLTGTCTGTSLAASAVSGYYLLNGSVLAGTGITGGTTVSSQTSGTPGGAGVYVVSASCTSSGASITATPPWIQAAETLSAGQRIYLNATPTDASGYDRFPSSAGDTYFDYTSGSSSVNWVVGNATALQILTDRISVPGLIVGLSNAFFSGGVVAGTGSSEGNGTVNAQTAYYLNGAIGATKTCGATIVVTGGIVTSC